MADIPSELFYHIYDKLSDPEDIIRVSLTSIYTSQLLRYVIRKLQTKDELMYLDIGWLSQYPKLEEVGDEIIFNINSGDVSDFSIPPKLKRFNIRILLDNTANIKNDRITYNIIKNIFEKIIEVGNIYEYTVRIIVNFEVAPLYDYAIVIDLGNYSHLVDFNRTNKLTYVTPVKPDFSVMFMSLGIELILNPTNVPKNIKYFNYREYNNSTLLKLNDIFYPNRNFSDFFDEVKPIILGAENNIEHEVYWKLVEQNYRSTGFMSFKIIKAMIQTYTNINELVFSTSKFNGISIIAHDEFLTKYLGSDERLTIHMRSSLNYVKDAFKYPDNNISPAHYYITDPLIQELYE